jgi:acetyltransferase-like isoleucine patch superfamily enzyme
MQLGSFGIVRHVFYKLLKKARGKSVRGSSIDRTSKIESGSVFINSRMARHSFCGYDCSILNCEVGAFCSIGSRVSIGGVSHPTEFVSTSPVFLSHKDSIKAKFADHEYLPTFQTLVGNDVWIGEGVFIKAGVAVGDGAVIGMGAVVTKNVMPYSIVAGNPARLIRMRFSDVVVDALLKMRWWDLSDSELLRLGPFFDSPMVMLKAEGLL